MICLSDVRVFFAIIQSGGLTAAGHQLNLPKSSVTRQLRRLETELGCRLIDRTTRRLSLTENGRTFLPYARRLLEDSDEAVNILGAGGNEATGLLSISAPYTFGRCFIAPELVRLRERLPKVRILLDLTSRRVDLAAEEIDIAFRLGSVVDTENLARKIGEIRFGLVAAPSYLAKAPALTAPHNLKAHDFVGLGYHTSNHRVDLHCGNETVAIDYVPVVYSNNPEVLRLACRDGAGVAALPLYVVQDDLEQETLVHVLPEWAPLPKPVHLIYLARAAQLARVRSFLDFFFETAASSRWDRIRPI
jgi:DNA-binding transcriptional LysR family regulator